MRIETSINSVKVIFDLQTREGNVAKSVGANVGVNVPVSVGVNVPVSVPVSVLVNVPVNVPVNLTATQQNVLNLINENPSITHIEMARRSSLTEKIAKRTTKALRKLDLIKREGSAKSGKWILNNR